MKKKTIEKIPLRAFIAFCLMVVAVIAVQEIIRIMLPDWETKVANLAKSSAGAIVLVSIGVGLYATIPIALATIILFKKLLPVKATMGMEKFGWRLLYVLALTMGLTVLTCFIGSKVFKGIDIAETERIFDAALAVLVCFVWALEAREYNKKMAKEVAKA